MKNGIQSGQGDGDVALPRHVAELLLQSLRAGTMSPKEAGAGTDVGVPGMGYPPQLAHHPGGELLTKFLHPAVTIVDEFQRRLPQESWFSPATGPNATVQFEIMSFEVPQGQHLWLYDYHFLPYRFSGLDPGDMVPVEEGRFSSSMGFDLQIMTQRNAHLRFHLDPTPVPSTRSAFRPSQTRTASDFSAVASNSFAAASSQGLSLQPARLHPIGPRGGPFTLVAKQGDRVALTAVIFKQVTTPLACIEGGIAGYLLQTQVSEVLMQRMRPR